MKSIPFLRGQLISFYCQNKADCISFTDAVSRNFNLTEWRARVLAVARLEACFILIKEIDTFAYLM